jgi:hypothetical protein
MFSHFNQISLSFPCTLWYVICPQDGFLALALIQMEYSQTYSPQSQIDLSFLFISAYDWLRTIISPPGLRPYDKECLFFHCWACVSTLLCFQCKIVNYFSTKHELFGSGLHAACFYHEAYIQNYVEKLLSTASLDEKFAQTRIKILICYID